MVRYVKINCHHLAIRSETKTLAMQSKRLDDQSLSIALNTKGLKNEDGSNSRHAR